MIRVVGLGPGAPEDLTVKSINLMKSANNLYLRTAKHPNVSYIRDLGINFETFDELYDSKEKFDDVYESIAKKIVEMGDVVYAVPGHPLVAEKSVQLIMKFAKEKGVEFEIVPALSFVDAVLNTLRVDPVNGLKIIDGLQLQEQRPDINIGNMITQVYSRLVASDIKIALMEYYDDEEEVILIRAAGVPGEERVERMPLYEIDRVDWVDYLTTLYIPPVKSKSRYNMDDLLGVMERLRAEDGCPWDREQTHESLKKYLVEESYEVIDAIDKNDIDALCEELGDVLLQVVFHSQIAREFGEFDIRDVINAVTSKMISRHSHVFGDDKCSTAAEVLVNWEEKKKAEKNMESYTETLKAVPKGLPALMRSYKVQKRAAKAGFDWEDIEGPMEKINEELNEFIEVYKTQKYGRITEEIGDLLFSVVNACRFLDIDPEFALTGTIEKFISRFEYIEESGKKTGKNLKDMTLTEMDELWNNAKCHQF